MANPNGAVRQRTAEDVAQMESDIAWYREETERLNRELAIALQERNRLQVENALLMGKSMENLAKASRVEAILDNVCNGLVMSLKGIREERHLDREIRRQTQIEMISADGGDPPPKFLERPSPGRNDEERADILRGAAERVAPIPPQRQTSQVNRRLADLDSRLPPIDLMRSPHPQKSDEDNLRDLSDRLSSTQGGK
jgi:regulator of replication initiation timing